MRQPAWVILPLVIWLSAALGAADAKPSISIDCELINIKDDPLKDDGISGDMKFTWIATNSDYVLISGWDGRQPTEGSFLDSGGGAYIFDAVNKGVIARQQKSCYHAWKQGLGIHGLIHRIADQFDAVGYFAASDRKPLTTKLSDSEILHRLDLVFGGRNLHLVQYSVKPPNLILFSEDYIADPKLCLEPDCHLEVGKRVIERVAAFDIWLEVKGVIEKTTTYELHIRPDVRRNWRKENRLWEKDPDGAQAANGMVVDLKREIENQLR